jgi:hypothetical protein
MLQALAFLLMTCCPDLPWMSNQDSKFQNATFQVFIEWDDASSNSVLVYPADEVTFELLDESGGVIASSSDSQKEYQFEGSYELIVYSSWNPGGDVIPINGKKVTIKPNVPAADDQDAKEEEPAKTTKNTLRDWTTTQITTPSKAKPGVLNFQLTLANGLTFRVVDGQASAFYQGEEIPVRDEYRVTTPRGILRVQFDPFTKSSWTFSTSGG